MAGFHVGVVGGSAGPAEDLMRRTIMRRALLHVEPAGAKGAD